MLTDERVAEIRHRRDMLTGPWTYIQRPNSYGATVTDVTGHDVAIVGDHDLCLWAEDDARFAAHAPQDIADLLAEVDRLKAELDDINACNNLLSACLRKVEKRERENAVYPHDPGSWALT